MHGKTELQQTTSASVADVTPFLSDKKSDLVDDSVESSLASLFESSKIADIIPFELVDRTELIRLQQSDPDLSSLFELAHKGDDCYCVRSGVLVRSWPDKFEPQESSIHQVIVPTTLRPKLLQIAHDIPAAGHLGITKTRSRLLQHFFWPSISRDTRSFCRTCDVCQRLGKGKNPAPAPLQSLPLVNEPFAEVAIDIAGLLAVCKATGNRFVLTVLDCCTHYPEAIPLKQHTAVEVVQALGTVFSRFGLPQEIL